MPLYRRFEMYQTDRVCSHAEDLENDESAERELARLEEEEGEGLRGMAPDELLRTFVAGSIGFGARRAEDAPVGRVTRGR